VVARDAGSAWAILAEAILAGASSMAVAMQALRLRGQVVLASVVLTRDIMINSIRRSGGPVRACSMFVL